MLIIRDICRRLGQKGEVNGADEHQKCHEMVPAQVETVESYEAEDGEHNEGYHFLHDLELDEGVGAAVALETHAVGGHLKTIFEEGDCPRQQDDGVEGPRSGDARRLEFEMTVPCESHEHVAYNKQQHCENGNIHYKVGINEPQNYKKICE